MPTHYNASFYPSQAVALQGYHYCPYGRFCALPSRHALGRMATVSYRVKGHWSRPTTFLVADVCGTPGRVDFAWGTFSRMAGPSYRRIGIIPIRLLSVSGRARHSISRNSISRNSRRHGGKK